MNDDFLKNYKRQPRPEFARSLRLKLSQKEKPRIKPVRLVLNYAFAALLIAVLSVAALPAARAKIASLFNSMVCVVYTTGPLPESTTPGVAVPISGEDVTEDELDLASALAKLGFAALLPTWLPDGLSRHGAGVMHAQGRVVGLHVYWESDRSRIDLYAVPKEGETTLPDVENSKKIEVNGQTALMITLDKQLQLYALEWTYRGVHYSLSGNAVSDDDLIKTARSVH
jgi:hypothetical protein